jgi:pyridoxal 5'-phosphate synthase pdxS subunit
VCGAQDLGEALRRIAEGAAMIRLKGNAGTGNVIQAVRHARAVFSEIRALKTMRDDELFAYAKELHVPVDLVQQVKAAGRLPVVTFAAGGLATPADVALLMELGCDGVFVGSGIFKGENPAQRARAMVQACTHYKNPTTVARVSSGLGKAMVGLLEHEEGPEVAAKLALKGRVGVDPGVAA